MPYVTVGTFTRSNTQGISTAVSRMVIEMLEPALNSTNNGETAKYDPETIAMIDQWMMLEMAHEEMVYQLFGLNRPAA